MGFLTQCHILATSLLFFSVINTAALKALNHMYLLTNQMLITSCIIFKFEIKIELPNT